MRFYVLAATCLLASTPWRAGLADITFSAAVTSTGNETDVVTIGTSVYAGNFTNANDAPSLQGSETTVGNFTVNGVFFQGNTSLTSTAGGNISVVGPTSGLRLGDGGGVGSLPTGFTLGSPYANNLLGGVINNPTTNFDVTLNNLTAGKDYMVQVWMPRWAYPSTNPTEAGQPTISDANTQLISVGGGSPTITGSGPQYVIGTFTAISTSEVFQILPSTNLFTGTPNFNSAWLGAIQVRDITAVPEPTSVALLGAVGLVAVVRRRWAKRA